MNLQKLLSISGKPGLYRMITNKSSGLIVEGLADGKREFIASRQHQFTPLESIAIFTDDGDSVPIRQAIERMQEQIGDNPLPDPKAPAEAFREYFLDVLPNHDPERVYVSDIKKLAKWYALLDTSGALTAEEPAAEEATAAEGGATDAAEGEVKEAAPKAKKPSSGKKPSKSGAQSGGMKGTKQSTVGVSKAGGQRKMGGG